ncbi:MAG: IS4 family transposase [Cyanobacteria bacterium P01_H01_bin.152]
MSHRYARNPDHIRRRNVPAPDNAALDEHLRMLLSPVIYSQQAYYRTLGMRSRILTLPLMVAAVVTLLWKQVPSVTELTRQLNRKDLLWVKAVSVSRQAVSARFLSFPHELFEAVFEALMPTLQSRWAERSRPLPVSVSYAKQHFEQVWAVDGSVLEALFRKLKSLEALPAGQLAGKICTVIELGSQLPVKIWFTENAKAHDCQFLDDLLALATTKTLLILDRGFYDFEWWAQLIAQNTQFICAGKSNLAYTVLEDFSLTHGLRDRLIVVGKDKQGEPVLQLRLIEVRKGKGWYRYLTSVLEPDVLPPYVVADLYAHRWRIEEAFHLVKRLLGLAYLWTGSLNGIKLQIWATWLMYAVLTDLSDAVAEAVQVPLERISKEMVWRGLYHFNDAYERGLATDPVAYFAAPENRDLSVVKTIRKPPKTIDFTPYFTTLSASP